MNWKTKLPNSSAAYLQTIVDQIPEANGARDAFEKILNELGQGRPPYTHVLIDEDGDAVGVTNDLSLVAESKYDLPVFATELAKLPVQTLEDYEDEPDENEDD